MNTLRTKTAGLLGCLLLIFIGAQPAVAQLIVLPCVESENECTMEYDSSYISCLSACVQEAPGILRCSDLCALEACAATESSGACGPCELDTLTPPGYGDRECYIIPGVYPRQFPGPWGTPPAIPENEIGIAGLFTQ